ncbi:MAG: hypothetical protein JWM80_2863 [Cyanobacteria bacterium RYN_339]|nr:hypothetical protein [Cyanobacteria bacterium RYN_339]
MTFDDVRALALSHPGMEEYTCHGTQAFRVAKRLIARLREDGETLVLKIGYEERDALLEAEPEKFFTTDHYRGYPHVLVRLPLVKKAELKPLMLHAWRQQAPKKLLNA